jgi:hypothetical protein
MPNNDTTSFEIINPLNRLPVITMKNKVFTTKFNGDCAKFKERLADVDNPVPVQKQMGDDRRSETPSHSWMVCRSGGDWIPPGSLRRWQHDDDWFLLT